MKKLKNVFQTLRRIGLAIFAILVAVLLTSQSAIALSGAQRRKFAANDIMFYNPDETGRKNCSYSMDAGENKDWNGNEIWSEEDMEFINNNMALYKQAADEYEIPWQMLPVIQRIETGPLTKTNPPATSYIPGYGLYASMNYADKNGLKNQGIFESGKELSDEEFVQQSEIAAGDLANWANRRGGISTDDDVKYVFFSYNVGTTGGPWQYYIDNAKAMGYTDEAAKVGEGSYYVMNRADPDRDPTVPEKMKPAWPGIHTGKDDFTTTRYGTFVLYKALAGGTIQVCHNGAWSEEDLAFYYQNAGDEKSPWATNTYGCSSQTIGSGGCGPTSLASIVATMTRNREITPAVVAELAEERGMAVCDSGSSHGIATLAEEYGLTVEPHNRLSYSDDKTFIEEVNSLLRSGSMFHILVGNGPAPFSMTGHFIAVRGVTDDGKWLLFDPASENNSEVEWDPETIIDGTRNKVGGNTWYEVHT